MHQLGPDPKPIPFLWAPGLSKFCRAGSFSSHNDPYQVILIDFTPIQCSQVFESSRDMEPDRGGKRKGGNGGRSGRVHWAGEFADPKYRRLIFGEGLT